MSPPFNSIAGLLRFQSNEARSHHIFFTLTKKILSHKEGKLSSYLRDCKVSDVKPSMFFSWQIIIDGLRSVLDRLSLCLKSYLFYVHTVKIIKSFHFRMFLKTQIFHHHHPTTQTEITFLINFNICLSPRFCTQTTPSISIMSSSEYVILHLILPQLSPHVAGTPRIETLLGPQQKWLSLDVFATQISHYWIH